MIDLSTGRRVFLRFTSIFPLAALFSANSARADASAEFCEQAPEHPSVPQNDSQFQEAKAILWDEFVQGTRAMGETPDIPVQTENHIIAQQGAILRRKVRFWSLCETETRYCCFSAGVVADAQRRAAGESEITIQQFNIAKAAVKATQAKKLGKAPVGIAC